MANEMNPFLVEVLAVPGGERVLQCYQCGTCSGSCPVIDEMEHGPRQIMNLIQAGEEEAVLSSHDMWFCVSCYSCTNRCPREIRITDLMASLRTMATEKGYAVDKEAQFEQSFEETYKRHGRLFEPELMTRYYFHSLDFVGLLGMVPLGIKMLLKNKLPFWPERIADPHALDKIFKDDHKPSVVESPAPESVPVVSKSSGTVVPPRRANNNLSLQLLRMGGVASSRVVRVIGSILLLVVPALGWHLLGVDRSGAQKEKV
ncbi:MAG: 4Fe-4S dicluster domain-containing protein [Anaerolineae bacterium]|nr:4Fe-4S dicluster domain-containing protein [Anaerolineae bacterium]